jgi:hypothetical protein
MNPKAKQTKTPPAPPPTQLQDEPEMDMERIIHPEEVEDNEDLRNYFWQRLGTHFSDIAFIQMTRETYLDLLNGDDAILAKMIAEDEDAANDIFLAYAGDKLNSVIMTFHIETPTTGNKAIEFLYEHKSTPDHEALLNELEQLSFKMQKLHHHWKRQPFPY